MSHSKPVVLTIVLNYKTAEMTLKSAAAARTAMAGIPGGIVIVDNDSQDGSFETICEHVSREGWDKDGRIRVIQSGRNGGFGAGNNVGIQAGLPDGSEPDYIYILNSDAFPAPDAIAALVEHLEAFPETGFTGSHIHGPDGEVHASAFRFPSLVSEFESAVRFGIVTRLLRNVRVPMEPPTEISAVDWVAGASLMMRKRVLDEIGLFDETFFLYFEETDLCLRAVRAGHRIAYVPSSKVVHIGSVSTGMKDWSKVPSYWYDSRWHYFAKNHGRAYAAAATLAQLVGGGLNTLRCLILRRKRKMSSGFLRTMLTHDLKAIVRRPESAELQPRPGHVL